MAARKLPARWSMRRYRPDALRDSSKIPRRSPTPTARSRSSHRSSPEATPSSSLARASCDASRAPATRRIGGIGSQDFRSAACNSAADGATIVANAFVRGGRVSHAALWWHDDPLAIIEIAPGRYRFPRSRSKARPRLAANATPCSVCPLWQGRAEKSFSPMTAPAKIRSTFSNIAERALCSSAAPQAPAARSSTSDRDGPGWRSDGTIALRGASRSREMILRLDQRGRIRVVATARETASAPGELGEFRRSCCRRSARRRSFPRMDSAGTRESFSWTRSGTIHEVDSAPVHDAAFEDRRARSPFCREPDALGRAGRELLLLGRTLKVETARRSSRHEGRDQMRKRMRIRNRTRTGGSCADEGERRIVTGGSGVHRLLPPPASRLISLVPDRRGSRSSRAGTPRMRPRAAPRSSHCQARPRSRSSRRHQRPLRVRVRLYRVRNPRRRPRARRPARAILRPASGSGHPS